jgi:hypothetical protein
MTFLKSILAGAAAAAAIAAFTTAGASAPPLPAGAKIYGGSWIVVDGYKYGGQLPVGADKKADELRMLIKVASGLGQMRDNQYGGSQYLVLGDTSSAMRVNATGTWNGQKANVVLDWDYRVPGVRLDVQSPDGKSRTVTVAANNLAWDEKTPGIFGGKATTTRDERLVIPYLMPSAAVVAGRDAAAEGLTLSKDESGRNVMTMPLAKIGPNVTLVATLNADYRPVRTQIVFNGKTYAGEFANFRNDRMDMEVLFPHQIRLTVDGNELADLTVNWHHANPYLIFPVPKEVAAN